MTKTRLAVGIAASALMTAAAFAQTSAPPASSAPSATPPSTSTQAAPPPASTQNQASSMAGAGSGQLLTQMSPDMMRGSKLMGVDVYGPDNQKVGDIDEVLVNREGQIQAVVIGVGGFLGIGQKDVAIPYEQLQWMSEAETAAATNTGAGGVSTPTSPRTGQPAATGSTGTTGATGTAGAAGTAASDDGVPERARISMTKDQLRDAPEFRYSANENTGSAGGTGAAGNTSPPASTTAPGTAPRQ